MAVLTLAALPAFVACQKQEEQMMAASAEIPGARGTVSTEKGDNDNIVVHVSVEHLASPSRIASGAQTYLVWIEPEGAPKQAVGALNVDEDLVGKLDFVTPHRVFRVLVTPEANPTVARPQNEPVFTTNVDAR